MAALTGPHQPFPFVGRTAELERLRTLMPSANGEPGRVVLVGGDAGSGKSRLVREFTALAAGDGALVVYGACDAVVRAPYGPFAEALHQLARTMSPEELRSALGPGGGELTRLLPDLGAAAGGLPPPVAADPDTERHRLHTAVADLLAGVTSRRPAVLVIEDGHWADPPTLLLLRHLARSGTARMLLLITFRDAEADSSEALSETLADLRRYEVARLRLPELSAEEVAEFVRRSANCRLGPEPHELAEAIRDLTGGNAFLVCELWRALVETGTIDVSGTSLRLTRPLAELGSPESVREVVSRRLSRLAPETTNLLELAAAAGAEFELDVIRRAAGLGEPELLTALDEAARSGMLEEHGTVSRFTHELVRRALYDRLSGPRRAALHLRVGEALEAGGRPSARTLADLAHHFAAAAPFGPAERAVEYNLLAARAAGRALAYDEAAARLRTALALGVGDPRDRVEAQLELGQASHRAGKAVDALDAFRAAADLAREIGDAELLARAAVGYEDACWRPGIADQGAAELLEEAAGALGVEDSAVRVGLLSGLARALDFQGHRARGALVRTEAIAMARRTGDRHGLASVLTRSYWSRGTTPLEEILAMLTEGRDLASELGDTELRAEAMAWRVPALVARCDLHAARQEGDALLAMAEQTAQPFMLHVAEHYRSALALCEGRLADAEAAALRSQDWTRLLTGRDPSGTTGIQMFSVRREAGRLAELAPVTRILAGDPGRSGPWRPGLVALLSDLGMEQEARRELSRIVAEGLDPYRATLWLASLTYVADACSALGDEQAAAMVYPELKRFECGNVMVGHLVSCYGAADRYLGMVASTLGEPDLAQEHFERALELNRRMGAHTWVAHTAYEYARHLLSGRRGDRAPAAALLSEAASLAKRIGMPTLLARVGALGSSAPPRHLPDGLSPREVQILGLVARGLSNRQVGGELSISEHTAANHVRAILRKTGCANRTEAASYAHRQGLVRG